MPEPTGVVYFRKPLRRGRQRRGGVLEYESRVFSSVLSSTFPSSRPASLQAGDPRLTGDACVRLRVRGRTVARGVCPDGPSAAPAALPGGRGGHPARLPFWTITARLPRLPFTVGRPCLPNPFGGTREPTARPSACPLACVGSVVSAWRAGTQRQAAEDSPRARAQPRSLPLRSCTARGSSAGSAHPDGDSGQ